MAYLCPIRQCTEQLEIQDIASHINNVHQDLSVFSFSCPLCNKSYPRVAGLVVHLKKQHPQPSSTKVPSNKTKSIQFSNQTTENILKRNNQHSDPENQSKKFCESDTRFPTQSPSTSMSQPLFLSGEIGRICRASVSDLSLELFSDPNLSRALALDILKNISTFTNELFSQTLAYINPANEAHNVVDYISQVVKQTFENYSSDYRVLKELEKEPNYIPFKSVNISAQLQPKKKKGEMNVCSTNLQLQIVSIGEILKKYLAVPNTFNIIMNHIEECKKNTEIMSVYQSSVWKNIESKYQGKIVLPISLFCDDFEVNNPLGTHKGVSQLCGIYFSLLCIPNKYKSSLDNIFVTQLHKSKDHNDYGNKRIFSTIIEELKSLERDGIEVNINGKNFRIYIALHCVVGDNLGLNKVLGFVTSFATDYCCRFCTFNKTEIKKKLTIPKHKLRNKENYQKHLEENSNKIIEDCVFNQLESFHSAVNINADKDHDGLLGTCRYIIGEVISYLMKNECFDLKSINSKIDHFDYGNNPNVNKPQKIKLTSIQNKQVVITMSEMKNIMTYLCFWVGPLVTDKNHFTVWKIYILLRKIFFAIDSSSFSSEKIEQLRAWIQEFNQLYYDTFGDLKYKFHQLFHYPDLIPAMGPPSLYSTRRYESEHQIIKKILHSTTSRINAAAIAFRKIQLQLCLNMNNNIGLSSKLSHGPIKNINILDFGNQISHLSSIAGDKKYLLTSWVSVYGTHYAVDMCIALGREDNDDQTFGKIVFIVIAENSDIYFIFKKLTTVRFSDHLQGFEIADSEEQWGEIKQENLILFKPRMIWRLYDGVDYIISM